MVGRFDYFVVFAEMRTGSNFLETNLNELPGVTCHGEAFNPVFTGYPNRDDLLGVTLAERGRDPFGLLDRIVNASGLNGFRYFHDHDPRILAHLLADPRCAKIVLTRNPVDSYVSRKIAGETGQWKLTRITDQRSATIQFDAAEFEEHLQTLQDFQVTLMRGLQIAGQCAFYLDYDDIQDLEVINGLAAYLGVDARLRALSRELKKQNPAEMGEKVQNLRAMELTLARLDRFNLSRTPGFEPRRGPMIPSYCAAAKAPLLFIPLRGGPHARVRAWLAALDGATVDDLVDDFTQKSLRQWKRKRPGHRSFAVLRHPVARAHRVFCREIVAGGMPAMRDVLCHTHSVALPDDMGNHDLAAHRAAFLAYLAFVKANLAGQTGVRVDPAWATQTALLQGVAQFAQPDLLLREEDLERDLADLAGKLRLPAPPLEPACADTPFALDDIYDDDVEAAAHAAYARDYMSYGFGPWRKQAMPPLRVV